MNATIPIHLAPPEASAATLPPWGDAPTSRAPGWVYTNEAVYQRELENLFYKNHWCYVGLECEIPKAGDYKRTQIGERSVVMVRERGRPGQPDQIHVVENRCAHRGVQFVRERSGNARSFVCPYHQWTYKLNGDLVGLTFKNGVDRVEADGSKTKQGGMAEDFQLCDHGLTKLKVARRGGVVFASFDHSVESFEDYLGPNVLPYFDRVFHKPLKLLGINRQRIPANWKLMQENIKDPYHPGLLHTWFVTFGLWRADQRSQMIMDDKGRHACMVSRRDEVAASAAVTEGVTSFKANMQLGDARLLDVVPEAWWKIGDVMPTVVMMTLFPSLIIQQQVNSLSTRHIQPTGVGEFDFVWTHFGFEDDTPEMTQRRLRQSNLFGPAGFVSADDGEVIEFVQSAYKAHSQARTISELDGVDVKPTDHMVTETLIRGMYGYWRSEMGI
ncbi:MAG: aromatic ring-hydroxylating dioxygenase subunit alpha [Burkholderiaceae bacterium]